MRKKLYTVITQVSRETEIFKFVEFPLGDGLKMTGTLSYDTEKRLTATFASHHGHEIDVSVHNLMK